MSTKPDPNAPAFPYEVRSAGQCYGGLTKREDFAMAAMVALVVAYASEMPEPTAPLGSRWILLRGRVAHLAAELADALIDELSKKP